uniref:UPAR/Ly6 domain-containing protein n=1 Tax=Cyclopterus lumpus TaxID=8103 RepID=A0A8C2ZCX5_CYCLU
ILVTVSFFVFVSPSSPSACLICYTCVDVISPLVCFKFPQECRAGQRCLSSTAMGTRGEIQICVRVCSRPSAREWKSGLSFNYSNLCCDTDNGARSSAALWRRGAALCMLPALTLLLA